MIEGYAGGGSLRSKSRPKFGLISCDLRSLRSPASSCCSTLLLFTKHNGRRVSNKYVPDFYKENIRKQISFIHLNLRVSLPCDNMSTTSTTSCCLFLIIFYVLVYISQGATVLYVPNAACATPSGLLISYLIHFSSQHLSSCPPLLSLESNSFTFLYLLLPFF